MMKEIEFDPNFYSELIHIAEIKHHNPHEVLGLHRFFDGKQVIRLWRPGAEQVFVEVFGEIVEAKKIQGNGIFEVVVPSHATRYDYKIYHQNGLLAHDPYAFEPTFGELDQYLFSKGVHYKLYERLGGRLCVEQGVEGAKFNVWAPNAKSVALVGDFNFWNGQTNPMRVLGYSGVWEIFIPGLKQGEKYKFEIHTQQGETLIKSDPYAVACEMRPATASILFPLAHYQWQDQNWLEIRKQRAEHSYPMSIYEVHLGSWRKDGDNFLNYRTIAHQLADYCIEMGFNYVELLPIQEHPLDESWGYQVSGFYAPTSRFGTPDDFRYFVDHLHQKGIGLILDWVPGHFPTDRFSLGLFDGSALYEHSDSRQGYHPHWHTHIFNFGRHEISNFLIANALYWFQEMHVDGLRVDAVASMLYLDYGRDSGDWIPNEFGGKDNLQAIEFLKHLNSVVHERCPGILMIAEESTSFPGITTPVYYGGVGFDLKWNMGWMNDTLRYFSTDCLYRTYHQNDLTFGLMYAFSERFLLVLSHDEVVHGKKNILSKMPGDMWQQFANTRLLISYMFCQPGKKLLFMGIEIGQWNEWHCKNALDWILLDFDTHRGVQLLVKDLNHLYQTHPALWEKDFHYSTFEWIDFADTRNCILSYLRKSNSETLLCVHNFTAAYHSEYILHLKESYQSVEEIFNSDDLKYGGSDKHNYQTHMMRNHDGRVTCLQIAIAPLATMIFKIVF